MHQHCLHNEMCVCNRRYTVDSLNRSNDCSFGSHFGNNCQKNVRYTGSKLTFCGRMRPDHEP